MRLLKRLNARKCPKHLLCRSCFTVMWTEVWPSVYSTVLPAHTLWNGGAWGLVLPKNWSRLVLELARKVPAGPLSWMAITRSQLSQALVLLVVPYGLLGLDLTSKGSIGMGSSIAFPVLALASSKSSGPLGQLAFAPFEFPTVPLVIFLCVSTCMCAYKCMCTYVWLSWLTSDDP